jgi:hypothetical protein
VQPSLATFGGAWEVPRTAQTADRGKGRRPRYRGGAKGLMASQENLRHGDEVQRKLAKI